MHLDRKVLGRINNLYQKGEAIAESLEILLSEQLLPILVYEGGKRHVFVRTCGHHGLVAFDTAYFPAFADGCLIGFYTFERSDRITAPNSAFEYWKECPHFIFSFEFQI